MKKGFARCKEKAIPKHTYIPVIELETELEVLVSRRAASVIK